MNGSEAFLAATGWAGAKQSALAGDASARRYLRLTQGKNTAILMIAPPQDKAAFDAFVSLSELLISEGFSPPVVLAQDRSQGLMLLEDLGDALFSTLGCDRADAINALAELMPQLILVNPSTELPVLTPNVMAEMTAIALPDTNEAAELRGDMAELFRVSLPSVYRLALRDFHAENLLWLPNRNGKARIGLLDFQDAVLAPPGYDLVSYIFDARHDVPKTDQRLLTTALVRELGLNMSDFTAQCAVLSFQRNLRIVGVFRRLAKSRGKPQYLEYLPRVFGHISDALQHPVLGRVRARVEKMVSEVGP